MIIDTLSIIVVASTIGLGIMAALLHPLLRKPRQKQSAEWADCPPLSLIITTHGDAENLANNLPLWLEQDYPVDLQVIVVTDKGDSQAEDIIKRLSDNKRLYATFVPLSSRYMSRSKLAVTLGVKAARHEWVMLTRADCAPDTPLCLKTLASHCDNSETNLVIGYTHYGEGSKSYHRFEHLYQAFYTMRKASKGRAYAIHEGSLLFKKSQFMESGGYQGSLHLIHGEYDFIANKLSQPDSTAVVFDPKGQITQQTPTRHGRRTQLTNAFEIGRHLRHGGWARAGYIIDQTALHLSCWTIIGTATWGALTQQWVLYGGASLALLVAFGLRTYIAKKAIRLANEQIPAWRTMAYELRFWWRDIATRIRYMCADKNDFTTHKL